LDKEAIMRRKEMNKILGSNYVKAGSDPDLVIEWATTGSLALDVALGGRGLPYGRFVMFWGKPSSCKTTIAYNVIANAQKEGKLCAFLDVEGTWNADWAAKWGIDIDALDVTQLEDADKLMKLVQLEIVHGARVIVLDSIAQIVPQIEYENEPGTNTPGAQARDINKLMRLTRHNDPKKNVLILYLNQERAPDTLRNPRARKPRKPGGTAIDFVMSVVVQFWRGEDIVDGLNVIGHKVKCKTTKNRFYSPFKTANFDFYFANGIDKLGELVDVGISKGVIETYGKGRYEYKGEKFHGRESLIEKITEEKLRMELEDEIREMF